VILTVISLVGTISGQLFFGFMGDKLGKRHAYMLALGITTVSAILQSCSFGTTANAVVGSLTCFRFFLGFGIGGGYPLSSTIMAEFSNPWNRGSLVAAVFAMQGVG